MNYVNALRRIAMIDAALKRRRNLMDLNESLQWDSKRYKIIMRFNLDSFELIKQINKKRGELVKSLDHYITFGDSPVRLCGPGVEWLLYEYQNRKAIWNRRRQVRTACRLLVPEDTDLYREIFSL